MSRDTAIFAIDPGTTHSAWVLWDGARVLDSGYETNENLLLRLMEQGPRYPWVYACEEIASMGMAVGHEVFDTCRWTGRFQQAVYQRGIYPAHMQLVRRNAVKLALCGTPRAKDPNIRQAIIDRFGTVGTKKNPGPLYGISSHKWSALAVAITLADSLSV